MPRSGNAAPLEASINVQLFNEEAEQAVIGGMLVNSDIIPDVLSVLEDEDFYISRNRTLFAIMKNMSTKGLPVDIVTIKNYLLQHTAVDVDADYVISITTANFSATNAVMYAQIVKQHALLRRVLDSMGSLMTRINTGAEIHDIMEHLENTLINISDKWTHGKAASLGDMVGKFMETVIATAGDSSAKGRLVGVSTGFFELDDMLLGLREANLYIIAGRPSMGKSSLALRIIEHVALVNQLPVLFFSLEMSSMLVATQMVCGKSRLNSNNVIKGEVGEKDLPHLIKSAEEFRQAPIFIDDSADLSPIEIRSIARKYKRKHGIKLIVIDYLQRIMLKEKVESRQTEVSAISNHMKALAKELNVPVIVLAQLNRNPEGREGKPMISDLRESGSIEQDADVVMLLYRDDYYKKSEDNENRNKCEVIVGKNRTGPVGTVDLLFIPHCARFENPNPDTANLYNVQAPWLNSSKKFGGKPGGSSGSTL